MDIGGRKEYQFGALNRQDLLPLPEEQLRKWLTEAEIVGAIEPNAMCLSTVSPEGQPSSRYVLLRGLDHRGLRFSTNYDSRKAQELALSPLACVTFWWDECERQVRIEGIIQKAATEESDAYFAQRPRESQLSAWASPQSSVIENREYLEQRLKEFDAQFPGPVPRPPNWGAYHLVPEMYEFWQGRPARVHDRFRYRKDQGSWIIERLAP